MTITPPATRVVLPHGRTEIEGAGTGGVERLGRFTAATIHEAQGRRDAIGSDIKPIARDSSFVGPATTRKLAASDRATPRAPRSTSAICTTCCELKRSRPTWTTRTPTGGPGERR